jgi:hypothetical protein
MSPSSYESGIGRRDMLCSGGSAIFSSLIAALLGGAKPARAQTISGNVLEVDRATVRVVQLPLRPQPKRQDRRCRSWAGRISAVGPAAGKGVAERIRTLNAS